MKKFFTIVNLRSYRFLKMYHLETGIQISKRYILRFTNFPSLISSEVRWLKIEVVFWNIYNVQLQKVPCIQCVWHIWFLNCWWTPFVLEGLIDAGFVAHVNEYHVDMLGFRNISNNQSVVLKTEQTQNVIVHLFAT